MPTGHKCTQEEVIARFREIHGDKFDYSLVDYKGMKIPVEIICPQGHHFFQTPSDHLRGRGCKYCARNMQKDTETFKLQAVEIWGDLYDLSLVNYVNWRTPVKIRCPIHGIFEITPNSFLRGHGCPKCGINARSVSKLKSKEEFVAQAFLVHKGYYNYDDSDYKGGHEPILIGCPKGHSFWQTPAKHLSGHGCTICNASRGETMVRHWLNQNKVEYIAQFRIKPIQVLFGRNTFIVDFFIPNLNTIIEYHGEQHYKRHRIWQNEEEFAIQQDRDQRLREHCKQNKIRLIEIPYTEIDNIDKILDKKIGRSQ